LSAKIRFKQLKGLLVILFLDYYEGAGMVVDSSGTYPVLAYNLRWGATSWLGIRLPVGQTGKVE
jgi:hypothetical protein